MVSPKIAGPLNIYRTFKVAIVIREKCRGKKT